LLGQVIGATVLNPVALVPGQSWDYELRIGFGLFEEERKAAGRSLRKHLAFEKPGTHRVRTGDNRTPHSPYTLESNTIEIKVVEPKGDDAAVWERLQRIDHAFEGLQWCDGPSLEICRKFMALLQEYPKTGYRTALRAALRRAYYRGAAELGNEGVAKIGVFLGIKELKDVQDERLRTLIRPDARIAIHTHRDDAFDAVADGFLKQLSAQSGVSLDADLDLKRRPVTVRTFLVLDLRHHMETVSQRVGAPWVRRGEKYVLTRE
jgi:hypothetical protein